jgi:hypothetical protein
MSETFPCNARFLPVFVGRADHFLSRNLVVGPLAKGPTPEGTEYLEDNGGELRQLVDFGVRRGEVRYNRNPIWVGQSKMLGIFDAETGVLVAYGHVPVQAHGELGPGQLTLGIRTGDGPQKLAYPVAKDRSAASTC